MTRKSNLTRQKIGVKGQVCPRHFQVVLNCLNFSSLFRLKLVVKHGTCQNSKQLCQSPSLFHAFGPLFKDCGIVVYIESSSPTLLQNKKLILT